MFQRFKNIWFWSGISKEDVKANPHSYHIRQVNKEEIKGKGYVAGLNEEESNFAATLNADGKDTYIL